MAKVIHVHLTHPIDGTRRKDWYFSSIKAVFSVFTADQVGVTGNGSIITKRAIIKQSQLIQCVKKDALVNT